MRQKLQAVGSLFAAERGLWLNERIFGVQSEKIVGDAVVLFGEYGAGGIEKYTAAH